MNVRFRLVPVIVEHVNSNGALRVFSKTLTLCNIL